MQTSPLMRVNDGLTSRGLTIEVVPKGRRCHAWLDETAAALADAAASWPSSFEVEVDDIAAHIETPEELLILHSPEYGVVGFVAASGPVALGRTGASARYLEGALTHSRFADRGAALRMLNALAPVDLEVCHTQNPHLARGVEARGRTLLTDVHDDLQADLRDLLRGVGRNPCFDAATCTHSRYYPRNLYGTWPIPGASYEGPFRWLLDDPRGAVLLLSAAWPLADSLRWRGHAA
jgi:hypothetical protein